MAPIHNIGSLAGYAMLRFERQQRSAGLDLDGLVFSVRWFLIVFCLPSICKTSDVIIPPVIIDRLVATSMIYDPGKTVSLPCTANGTSPLIYEWLRNGEVLKPEPNRIHLGSDGNLSLRQPDEGFYQCRVRNGAGVAVSGITHLQSPVIKERPGTGVASVVEDAFLPLLRPCDHILRSVPAAEISWQYDDNEESRIVPNDRIIVTDNGSLVFTWLLPNDSNRDSSFYKCVATNPVTGRGVGGSYFNLKVNRVSSGGNHGSPPHLIYSSGDTVNVLEGKPFSLWCIFSGVNTSGAFWQLPNRTTLPPSWQLYFPMAKSSDDGDYSCSAVDVGNPKISTVKTIRVIVDALPQLEEPLQGQKVQRGDSAKFTCRGTGRPPPTVSWLINGTLYNGTAHNRTWYDRFLHQGNSSLLLLPDVQSSASIACNVSNIHGHQLSSSYLIVGDPVTTTTASLPSSPSRSALTPTLRAFSSSTTGSNKESEESSNSSAVSPGYNEGATEKQNLSVGFALGEYGIPVMVASAILVLLISLTVAVICVLMRRRRNRKYSLQEIMKKDAAVRLQPGGNRGLDGKPCACDSDDSGYDDVGRKPSASLKPKKHLPDPAVIKISRL